MIKSGRVTKKSVLWKTAIPILAGGLLALLPAPEGLEQNAWYYFALFSVVILALMLEPIPPAAVGFIGVTAAAVLALVHTPSQMAEPGFNMSRESIKWALSGFSNTTVWLIFCAFMFALGYAKTGLGKRVALFLVKRLGGRTLGLGYAVTLADTILAPFTPSNTARSGGIIYPILRNIPPLYGSSPEENPKKIGSYLMWTAFAATSVTSSLFLTSMAPNLLAVDIVYQTTNLEITWAQWFLGFLPAGIILLLLVPYVIYKLNPPEIKTSTEVPSWAAQELKKTGPISLKEYMMGGLILLALALWIFGGSVVNPTTVGVGIIALMLITGVITWEDVLGNKPAWNVLVWFATLVTLAGGLNQVGFVSWFAQLTASSLKEISPLLLVGLLVAFYFLIHYMFASITAHVTALLPVILVAGAVIPGLPIKVFAMMLCYCNGIMGIITPYATGPAPVYFGSGFISRRDFWRLGLVFGLIFLVVLVCVCLPYLRMVFPG